MGVFFGTLQNLATMLSNSTAFMTYTGTTTAVEALEYIHYLLSDIDSNSYPFAILTYTEGDFNLTRDTESAGIQAFANRRSVTLCFEDKQEYTAITESTFMQNVDLILTDILEVTSVNNIAGNVVLNAVTIDGSGLSYNEETKTFQVVFKLEVRA